MAREASSTIERSADALVDKAEAAARHPWIDRLVRLGYVVRGVIYVIIGALAVQLAWGDGGTTADPSSAIELLKAQPSGRILLLIVVVGLAGYALWGFVRAAIGAPGHDDHRHVGLERIGYVLSGLSYASLLVPTTLALLRMFGVTPPFAATSSSSSIWAGSFGRWAAIGLGVGWAISGIAQVWSAVTDRFRRDLNLQAMSETHRTAAIWLGRVGYAARGVVFALVGVLLLRTGYLAAGQDAPGIDEALAALAAAPFGPLLLGGVALGLVIFGAFSMLSARWGKTIRQTA